MSDKGDIQNVQGRGACRTCLKTNGLDHLEVSSGLVEIYTVVEYHQHNNGN